MSKKYKRVLRILSLLLLLTSFIPLNQPVLAAPTLPPVDMFQLPWEQGKAWVAIDGFDNGSNRLPGSPHNYRNGGAIDFAPHNNMIRGENTSNFWVAAAADGTIVEISKCNVKIAHANGWVSEYQHLANIQVKLGDVVARNQKLAVIANASTQPVCPGSEPPDIPHLHFVLRPTMVGVTFAGWEFRYNWFWNNTTFRKGNQTLGLYKPLLNVFDVQPTTPTPSPATSPTATPGGQTTVTPGNPPTVTPTAPSGPYVSTTVNVPNINIGETALATVSLNNVPSEGYTSAEFTCTYQANLIEVSNIAIANLFGADSASAISNSQSGFIIAIAGSKGNRAATSGPAFTFDVKGLDVGQTALECTARVSKGDNVLTPLPSVGTSLSVLGALPTPTFTSTPVFSPTPSTTPGGSASTPSPAPSITPFPTTTPISGWLTFTDVTYSFQFQYPPQGQIQADSNDANTRINNLPIVQPGTNLTRKFMDVLVGQNITDCKSIQVQDPGVTVTINGMPFLKQTGMQGAAGSNFQLVEYSTLRDGVCVNLEFVLQSHDPSAFPTPPPVFDYAAESDVFGQIVSTYQWLDVLQTSTPTLTAIPVESPTPTLTFTPVASPTPMFTTPAASPTPLSFAMLTGQVLANKPVTVSLYDLNSTLIDSVTVNPDGTFSFTVSAGAYNVVATASGYLSAQGTVTLTPGGTSTQPSLTLLAGDIDGNNVIDQFDAMTIGMSYNTAVPAAADLNNDGIINVIDLELLAKNYRKTGPVAWQ